VLTVVLSVVIIFYQKKSKQFDFHRMDSSSAGPSLAFSELLKEDKSEGNGEVGDAEDRDSYDGDGFKKVNLSGHPDIV